MIKKIRIFSTLLLFWVLQSTFSQSTFLPTDTAVRIGTLPNGLTYYVRHNNYPQGQANFYIAQKVGSIQEDENQRGLAHFLEHMCFNGTTHFPGNQLIKYLESIGVKFGTNLNAYTSFDQTVYNIDNVPLKVPGVLDSCLLILYDWSNELTLDTAEIDKERGVIHEEWRSRRSAMSRMYDDAFPILLKDSKYANRLPIGKMSVIDNFPYHVLRDYYEKWYRPDLQGIIVVGDIDVNEVEQKIIKLFGATPSPVNPEKRESYEVPDNIEPLISVTKDKEQKQLQTMVLFKHNIVPENQKNTEEYYKRSLVQYFAASVLNNRFSELLYQEEPPFLAAKSAYGKYLVANTKDAFTTTFASTTEGFSDAFDAVLIELERAHRHGATQSELDRQLADYKNRIENFYLERNNVTSKSYVQDYVNHFLSSSPILSRQQDYDITKKILPSIQLQDINNCFEDWLSDSTNISIAVFCPEDDNLPTTESVRHQFENRKKLEIEPYDDKTPVGELVDSKSLSLKGKVVKERKGKFGSTIWTLSNGVRMILKPTDLKENQIRLTAISPGGTSLYGDNEIVNLQLMSSVATLGGYGDHNRVQMRKLLSGKSTNVVSTVATLREGIVGYTTPKDFETMMQLVYLQFTAPRKDSVAYNSFINRYRIQLEGKEKDPSTALSDSLLVAMYGNHPRSISFKPSHLNEIDYDRSIDIFKERFENAGDFTFYLVGNFNIDSIKPFIEKYIGALPSSKSKENFVDRKRYLRKGNYENNFTRKMETPKSTVVAILHTPGKTNIKREIEMDMLTQILRMVYTEEIREKEGGTYSVSVKGAVVRIPKQLAHIQISFTTNPERREHLTKLILDLYSNFAKKGPDSEMIEKVRQYMLKRHNELLVENRYWMDMLTSYYWENEDKHTKYEKIVKETSAKEIQRLAKKILDAGNLIQVSMTGINE